MEVSAKDIRFKERLRLIPIGDTHIGSRAVSMSHLNRTLKMLEEPDTYAFLMGDMADLITHTDKRFSGSSTREDWLDYLDGYLNHALERTVEVFKPHRNKILGCCQGNHEETAMRKFQFDFTRAFCKEMEIPNLGYSFLYRLTISPHNQGEKPLKRNLVVYGHHGKGGGQLMGSAVNTRQKTSTQIDADIVIMGHDHRKFCTKMPRVGVSSKGTPRIVAKDIILCGSGTYLRTFTDCHTTYGERAGYPPTSLGSPIIEIRYFGQNHDIQYTCIE